METTLQIQGQPYRVDWTKPHDISIALRFNEPGPNCFYAPLPEASPVVAGDFIGSTAAGGPVNFLNLRLNPHGNGTHTECVGHIALEPYRLPECLRRFHFSARLISLYPQRQEDGDRVITREQLMEVLLPGETEAVVIRTLPNDDHKLTTNYSGANPPYLTTEAATLLADYGIDHLLIDLPSIDREEDGGAVAAHHAFWRYPRQTRTQCTITELIYVPESIPDGLYLLNLQTASLMVDVSPSKPVLYALSAIG
ncbi:MAG: cyclase family protein [Lewinella sp.]|nr:cyclase family protein [Lewinella sp.]